MTAPAPISPDARALVIESLRAGCDLATATRAARVPLPAWEAAIAESPELAAEATAAITAAREDAAAARAEIERAAAWERAQKASAEREREEAERRAAAAITKPRARRAAGTVIANDPGTDHVLIAPPTGDDGAPDWARIRAEAAECAPGPYGLLLWQEERLAARGFPRLSSWWLWTAEGFFASLKRWLLALAGRGAGKSTILTRLAVVLALFTERRIAPGQTWIWPFVSVLPVDAKRRLTEIQAVLMHAYALERKITSPDSTPTLAMNDAGNNSIAWVSSASTIGNVSGPSSIGATMDEEEKILCDRAGEILGSLGQTFRARPGIRGFRVSSAMTSTGTLARAVRKGSTITNYVATLGPFVADAVAGLLEVAAWEEGRGDLAAAQSIRLHAATLTPESWSVPTWLGHPSIGNPDERANWSPGEAAIATRIEAEATDEDSLGGLPPWRYWLRECASVPSGADDVPEIEGDYEPMGEPCRNAELMSEDRGYG